MKGKSPIGQVNTFSLNNEWAITYTEIACPTQQSKLLSKIIDFVRHGWPSRYVVKKFKAYFLTRPDLSHEAQCLLLGHR